MAISVATVLGAVLILVGGAAAADHELWVRYLSDAVDVIPGDGYCIASGIGCTLRAAIQEANALGGDTLIHLDPGTYRLQLKGVDNVAATGDLDILGNVTIRCEGPEACIVEAGASASSGIDRVFDVGAGASFGLIVQ
ncbi:MAG: hypothetical protein HYV63_13460, partial [Candidatus Schekmanbacteria bacterium]|nr:hypothetical protein [Candidatus Schekmanbacteria bacterium]